MSQLHTSGEDDSLPFPEESKTLLSELCAAGAGLRQIWITPQSLADRTDLSLNTVREYLRWLASNGYIRYTVVDGGQLVSITPAGRAHIDYPEDRRERVAFTGHVADGEGKGEHFVQLEGYARQFRQRLGYEPYPGTLNIALSTGSIQELDPISAIPIDAWSDSGNAYGAAHCYPARLETSADVTYHLAHVLVPDRTSHDDTTLELLAPTKLRASPDVETGADVTVYV